MAHVALHRLLAQEQAVADLAVREAVADELKDLDLPRRRLLFELRERDGNRERAGVGAAARRDRLESLRMSAIAAEDLAALGCVHEQDIGRGRLLL